MRTSGIYNVEWLTFRRDERGWSLSWWRERCIEWCYHRLEDGKLGDQNTSTTGRALRGVTSFQHLGGGLAPWNISAHRSWRMRRLRPRRWLSLFSVSTTTHCISSSAMWPDGSPS